MMKYLDKMLYKHNDQFGHDDVIDSFTRFSEGGGEFGTLDRQNA